MTVKNPLDFVDEENGLNGETVYNKMYPRVLERGPVSTFRRYTPDQARRTGCNGWLFDKKEIGWQLLEQQELPDNHHNGQVVNSDWSKYTQLERVNQSLDLGPGFNGLTSRSLATISETVDAVDTYEPCNVATRNNVSSWGITNINTKLLQTCKNTILEDVKTIEWEKYELVRLGTTSRELIYSTVYPHIQARYVIFAQTPSEAIIGILESQGYEQIDTKLNCQGNLRGKPKTLPPMYEKTKY
jgi:hypothetical protein